MRANLLRNLELPERYEGARHVAHGGMASVWSAEDVLLGRRVAIKLLDERFQRDAAAVARFMREARTAAKLSAHRHVVTIFDVGESGGRAFIVMEYLSGGTVADALRSGPVQRADALRWLREAADALDFAHSSGVVHRDIKPANLLLDRDRVLHIGDFGIARLATEDTITASGELLGTAAYLSPEQALGKPATAASDRYALAVAAFELLVGARPFTAEHFAAQARQHVDDEPPRASSRNPRLPGALDAVLARGMAKRPEQRWPTAQALVAAISDACPVRSASASPRRAIPAVAPRDSAPPRGSAPPRDSAPPRADRGWSPRVGAGGARPRSRRGRALALAALAGVALVAALLASSAGTGPSSKPRPSPHASRPARHATVSHPATRTPTTSAPASGGSVPAGAPVTPSGDAGALEARGHQLMLSGSYAQAIPTLRQAVASADPSTLTYAYALYDLGHSLRLAGDPQAAIPILEQRLRIPNQTDVVSRELQLAQQQAGSGASAQPGGGGSGAPGTAGGKGDHGNNAHAGDQRGG